MVRTAAQQVNGHLRTKNQASGQSLKRCNSINASCARRKNSIPGYDGMTTAYCVQLPHSVYILQVPGIAHQERREHTGCLLAYSNPLHPESHWRHQRWYATRLLNIMLHASIQDTLAAKKGPSKRVGLSISGPHVWAGTDVLQNCGASSAGKPQPSCLPAGCRLTASQL